MSSKGFRRLYILLCLVGLLTMVASSLVNPLLSIFSKSIGASGLYIGLAVAGYWISRVFLEIPSGFILMRLGYYRLMVLGLLLIALGNLLCSYVSTPTQLILARILSGIGPPFFFGVAMTFVINLSGAEHRGSAMGLFQGIEFLGSIAGSMMSGYVISTLGFRMSFQLSSLIVFLALLMLMPMSGMRKAGSGSSSAPPLSLSSMREVLSSGNLLIACSAIFSEFILTQGVLFTVFPIHANEGIGISLTEIGLLMGMRSIGHVVSVPIMGWASDKIGRRPIILFGLAASALLTISLNAASSLLPLAVLMFALGMTTGAIWIVSPVIAGESVPEPLRGVAIGTYRTSFDLGSVLGPIIMSSIMRDYGISTCFYISSALLLANLAPALKIKEHR
ncbi:MFS transporter [Candidatus Bathyarchaeota archaeon]|nr:MFS transporter [Candidatus Bathyarchaeota archaeon]